MRRLNVKLLAGLLGGTVLFGTGIHFLHGYQLKRNAGALLDQAGRAEEQGQLDRAVEYLGRYLAYAPADADALARYGLLLDKQARTPRARKAVLAVLEQVLRLDGQRADVRRQLVRLALDLGQFADAREHLEVLLKTFPDDAELELLLGRCYEANGKYDKARACYEKAVADLPQQREAYLRLARLLRRRLDQPKQADATLDAMVAANPDSFQAYLARARAHQVEFGSLRQSEQDIARARALAPDEIEVLLAAAELAQEQDKLDEARGHLRRGYELHPRDGRSYQALARLEFQAGRRDEAIACLRRGLEALPQHLDLRWALVDMLIQGDKPGEAAEVITRLREEGFPAAPLDYMSARILVSNGQWLEAAGALARVQPLLLEWPDLARQAQLALGQCHEQLGNPDQAYAAYHRASLMDPLWLPARFGMASALVSLGKIDGALEIYEALAPRSKQARLAAAQLRVLKNLGLPPAQRRWPEVERVLDELAAALPDAADVPLLRAEVHAAQDRLDRARAVLEAARVRQPKQVELWTALAVLAEREGKPAAAMQTLDDAARQLGPDVALRLARVRHWARRGGDEARRFLAGLAGDLETLSREDQHRLLHGLASAYLRLGDNAEAERLLGRLAGQRPHDLGTRLVLFDLASRAGSAAKMGRLVEDVRRIEGADGTLWRYAQAALLIWQAQQGNKTGLGEARALVTVLGSRRANWSRVPLAEAQIDELLGNEDAATAHYLRAVELGETQPAVLRRTVELLYQRRRYVEADEVLRKLPEQAAVLTDLQRVAAEVSLHTRDYGRALALAQKAVAAGSTNYRDHVWLGQVLWAAGRRTEAEPELRKAVRLAEDVPDTWVALVQYLAYTDQKEKAADVIGQAQAKLPKDRAALALAQCYEMIDQPARAKELYAAALAERPDDIPVLRAVAGFQLRSRAFREAEPHLRKLLAFKIQAPEAAAWARRVLAVVLAGGGTYQQSQEALALLGLLDAGDQRGASPADTVEDLRTRAVVLANQAGRQPRREAVRVLEELRARQALQPDDQFLLAQLYEATGDAARAREQMLSLLAQQGENPAYLAYHVGLLLRRQQTDGAVFWVARLEQAEPDSFRTLDARARLLRAQGKADEAVSLVQKYAEKKGAKVRPAAALLEELAPAAAEPLYRRHAVEASRPESALVLAGYLARRNRLREALDVCERAAPTCPAEAVTAACLEALYAADPDEEQARRVERWLEQAARKDPKGTAHLEALAALRNVQGRYRDAEALYREVLARGGRSAEALNNLAWLLALQEGRGAEALELVKQAVALTGPVPDLLDTRAVVHLALGRSDAAISDLEEVLEQTATAPRYFHLAQAHLLARDRRAAAAALEKAVGLGLKANDLHPLERAAYQRLRGELGRTADGPAAPHS